jgi:cytochrome bd ubiquinol oxidase subunit I
MVLYGVLLLAFLWYGWRIVIQGPEAIEPPTPNVVRPGIDRAATALVSGVPAQSASVAAAE